MTLTTERAEPANEPPQEPARAGGETPTADAASGATRAAPGPSEPVSAGAQPPPPDTAAAPGPPAREATPEPSGCTQAQLRRFIKSRPYVPMHELRRRFELNGSADDVSPIRTSHGTIYVGLPAREAAFVGDLTRQGEIGLELCHDPLVPMVVGVYATRPITR